MRGKLSGRALRNARSGLIPAHAGKTHHHRSGPDPHKAHPRACGENWMLPRPQATPRGSSPRMRGKRVLREVASAASGLIPAHAGKTIFVTTGQLVPPAHPRACGENLFSDGDSVRLQGSSPRMRGKPRGRACGLPRRRLIPAHAGKTPTSRDHGRQSPAHPRACGENDQLSGHLRRVRGSSPRMRGKLPDGHNHVFHAGLIPAHAGKTKNVSNTQVKIRAHPRACGENSPVQGQRVPVLGSSPRMRGKLFPCRNRHLTSGLIPAHAGKTRAMGKG